MAFDGTLKFDTAIDQTGFQSGLSGLGNLAKAGLSGLGDIAKAGMTAVTGAVTALTGATTAATGAVTALGKQAVESYADFEQLSGGVETLFGNSAKIVMNNAAKAFETAGMSANQYMETATASAAAMINSLAGDTKRAAELTDMAVVDMSDNINKMGSTAESVQNAYAGFAKGNFTMLDNLKLGYGGTKQEMERLLQTAQKISGIEYNIDSYADIVQAIHVIQKNMGISGTTAKEAAETISGSVAMVKAAWSNMLVGIADDTQDFDKLTDNLVTSVEAAAKNILPRVEVTAGGIVKLVDGLSDEAAQLLADLAGYVPMATNAGVSLIQALASGIRNNLPQLLSAGRDTILNLSDGIANAAPVLFDAAGGITTGLAESLSNPQVLGSIGRAGSAVISGFVSGISGSAPAIVQAGLNMGLKMLSGFGDITVNFLDLGANLASSLASGIETKLPQISGTSREILLRITKAVGENLSVMLESGTSIMEMLSQSITDNLPRLTIFGNQAVRQIAEAIRSSLPDVLQAGTGLIGAFGSSIIDSLPVLLDCAVQIMNTLVGVISNPEDLSSLISAATLIVTTLGKAMLDNLQPLLNAGAMLINALISALAEPDSLEELMNAGLSIIMGLVEALTINVEPLMEAAVQIIMVLGTALLSNLPVLLDAGLEVIRRLMETFSDPDAMTELLDAGLNLITAFAGILTENLSPILGAVIAIIGAMGGWLGEHALDLVEAGLVIVQAVVDAVIQNLPLLLDAAVQIVEGLCKGIEEDSDDVLIAVEQIIRTLLDFLLSPDTIKKIGETGGKVIRALIPAAKELAADLLGFAYDLFDEYGEALLNPDWGEIGKNIVEGILGGILGVDFDSELFKSDFAENWIAGFKDIFGIHSPSTVMRDQIGKNLALGLTEGFSENIGDAAADAFDAMTNIPAIPLQFEKPEMDDSITVNLAAEAADVLASLRQPQTPAIADPAVLDLMLNAPPISASSMIGPSPTASVTNNYTTTNNTSTASYSSTEPASSGDIIIPVSIGGEQLETLVITAAQLANARSGGATI